MEAQQRIKELRMMFLQLSEIIIEELKNGKNIQSSQTFDVMKKIQAELKKLEDTKGLIE